MKRRFYVVFLNVMDSSIKGWLKGTKQGTEFFSDFYYFSDLLTKMKKMKFFQEIKNSTMLHNIFETYFVGNKAKEKKTKHVKYSVYLSVFSPNAGK